MLILYDFVSPWIRFLFIFCHPGCGIDIWGQLSEDDISFFFQNVQECYTVFFYLEYLAFIFNGQFAGYLLYVSLSIAKSKNLHYYRINGQELVKNRIKYHLCRTGIYCYRPVIGRITCNVYSVKLDIFQNYMFFNPGNRLCSNNLIGNILFLLRKGRQA